MALKKPTEVNRHTGGLEMIADGRALFHAVNRHTGGLENSENFGKKIEEVNRHTGGLEIWRI